MVVLPLRRLAFLTLVAAVPAVAIACAGASDSSTSDDSALTAADDARFEQLLLEAFSTTTDSNYRTAEESLDHSCFSADPATQVRSWNATGGQWFASSLRAQLTARGVTDQLLVVKTPSAAHPADGSVDIRFVGVPTNLDGAALSLCGDDAGAGNAVVLFTCRTIPTLNGMVGAISAQQCSK